MQERVRGLVGSVWNHRSLPPEFELRRGHIWRVFHLWLRFITLGGRSARLAYHVQKSGHKTSIIIIIISWMSWSLFYNNRSMWILWNISLHYPCHWISYRSICMPVYRLIKPVYETIRRFYCATDTKYHKLITRFLPSSHNPPWRHLGSEIYKPNSIMMTTCSISMAKT